MSAASSFSRSPSPRVDGVDRRAGQRGDRDGRAHRQRGEQAGQPDAAPVGAQERQQAKERGHRPRIVVAWATIPADGARPRFTLTAACHTRRRMPALPSLRYPARCAWILVIAARLPASPVAAATRESVRRDACGAKVRTIDGRDRALTYRGADDVVADVPVLCERLRCAEAQGARPGRGLAASSSSRWRARTPPRREAAARTGRLALYDWEAERHRPGRQAGARRSGGHGRAGRRARGRARATTTRCCAHPSGRPTVEADNARTGSRCYAVDPEAREVFGSGAATRAARAGRCAARPSATRPRCARSSRARVVLRGDSRPARADGRWYFVLRDDVALRGARHPRSGAALRRRRGGSGAPIVTFDFTAAGAKAFETLTRTLAERGARSVGARAGPVERRRQPALRDRRSTTRSSRSRTSTSARTPRASTAATGSQIQGGFTIASAQALASVLRHRRAAGRRWSSSARTTP